MEPDILTDLFGRLEQARVRLAVVDGRLRVEAEIQPPDDLLSAIQSHRRELVEAITGNTHLTGAAANVLTVPENPHGDREKTLAAPVLTSAHPVHQAEQSLATVSIDPAHPKTASAQRKAGPLAGVQPVPKVACSPTSERDRWTADPRADDLPADSAYWADLLSRAYDADGNDPNGLFGALHGLRCCGAQLQIEHGSLRLVAGEIPAADYLDWRERFLIRHAAALTALLSPSTPDLLATTHKTELEDAS